MLSTLSNTPRIMRFSYSSCGYTYYSGPCPGIVLPVNLWSFFPELSSHEIYGQGLRKTQGTLGGSLGRFPCVTVLRRKIPPICPMEYINKKYLQFAEKHIGILLPLL